MIVERPVHSEESVEESWHIVIDGVNYLIDPRYEDKKENSKDDNDEISKIVIRTLHGLRNEGQKELKSVYFDRFGRRRNKSESNKIRDDKKIILTTLDRHIDILQGKISGDISFIKACNGETEEIVGITISDGTRNETSIRYEPYPCKHRRTLER